VVTRDSNAFRGKSPQLLDDCPGGVGKITMLPGEEIGNLALTMPIFTEKGGKSPIDPPCGCVPLFSIS